MRTLLTQDQRDLQKNFREVFTETCTVPVVHAARTGRADSSVDQLWSVLTETGFFSIPFPDDVGGAEATLLDLGLLYQEAGRTLCPTAVYSTMNFGLWIDRLGAEDQRTRWLAPLVSGQLRGTVAPELGGLSLSGKGAGTTISGTTSFVPDAGLADAVIVMASDGGRAVPIVIELPADRVTVEQLNTISGDTQFRLTFDALPVDSSAILGSGPDTQPQAAIIRDLRQSQLALECLDMVGGAEAVVDRTVKYIIEREQFGRAIASFQAAQHHISNMVIAATGARLASYQALWLLSEGHGATRELSIAKAKTNEAYKFVTLTSHQLHGGMGLARESNLYLWSERAKASELDGGTWDKHLRVVADAILA